MDLSSLRLLATLDDLLAAAKNLSSREFIDLLGRYHGPLAEGIRQLNHFAWRHRREHAVTFREERGSCVLYLFGPESAQRILVGKLISATQDDETSTSEPSWSSVEAPSVGGATGLSLEYCSDLERVVQCCIAVLESWRNFLDPLDTHLDTKPTGDTESNTNLRESLTQNDRRILLAMRKLSATKLKPESANDILRTAMCGDPKTAFKRLRSEGLVDSKGGRSGGYWLTGKGERFAQNMDCDPSGCTPSCTP
jgi:hypothetical protein